jgi:cytosine/adenosine deaminase-related metal-dependent hydrolase
LASNRDLDLRRELDLFRARQPAFTPREILEIATSGGARALGLEGRAGVLAPGAWADLALHETDATSGSDLDRAFVSAETRVREVWVAGRPAWTDRDADSGLC